MNRGAQKLAKKLSERGAKAEFARRVGVKLYQLSHWLAGRRRPNMDQRRWLEDNEKIGWRLWDDEVESQDAA
jgi:transcriptional regulator with XRE-family HTH domain